MLFRPLKSLHIVFGCEYLHAVWVVGIVEFRLVSECFGAVICPHSVFALKVLATFFAKPQFLSFGHLQFLKGGSVVAAVLPPIGVVRNVLAFDFQSAHFALRVGFSLVLLDRGSKAPFCKLCQKVRNVAVRFECAVAVELQAVTEAESILHRAAHAVFAFATREFLDCLYERFAFRALQIEFRRHCFSSCEP